MEAITPSFTKYLMSLLNFPVRQDFEDHFEEFGLVHWMVPQKIPRYDNQGGNE
jgi:hypothetical protein